MFVQSACVAKTRAKCQRRALNSAERQWPIGNINIPRVSKMRTSNLKVSIQVLCTIEQIVAGRYKDSCGPISVLLGMTAIVGSTTKVLYILNILGLLPSYETAEPIWSRMHLQFCSRRKGNMEVIPRHEIAV